MGGSTKLKKLPNKNPNRRSRRIESYNKHAWNQFCDAANAIRKERDDFLHSRGCANTGDTITVDYFLIEDVLRYIEEHHHDMMVMVEIRDKLRTVTVSD